MLLLSPENSFIHYLEITFLSLIQIHIFVCNLFRFILFYIALKQNISYYFNVFDSNHIIYRKVSFITNLCLDKVFFFMLLKYLFSEKLKCYLYSQLSFSLLKNLMGDYGFIENYFNKSSDI